jgi:hypothetical protein
MTILKIKRRGIVALEYLMLGGLVAIGLGYGATEMANGYRQSFEDFGQQVESMPRLSPQYDRLRATSIRQHQQHQHQMQSSYQFTSPIEPVCP